MIEPDKIYANVFAKPDFRRGFSHRRTRLTLCLLALSLGSVGLAGCNRGAGGGSGGDAAGKAGGTTASAAETTVTVAPVALRSMSASISITGALTAEKDVIVGAKTSGKVVDVKVREGDMVHSGAIVALMDTTDLKIQQRQQEAGLATARTRQTQAESALKSAQENKRLTDTLNAFAITQARAGLDSAQAALHAVVSGARPEERVQARKNLEAAQHDLEGATRDLKSAQLDNQRAQDELRRNTQLHTQGAISDQQFVQGQIAAQSTENRVQASEDRLNAIRSRTDVTEQALRLVENGARQEDRDRAEAAVSQAKATYESALNNKQAQSTLRQNEIENAIAGRQGAVEGVTLAKAQLDQTRQALEDTIIRSPISGYVAERKVEPGMQLTSAKADVMRIVDTSSLFFDGQLSETQFAQVRQGQAVQVTIDAAAGKNFQGRVEKIYPVASSAARSFTAHIRLFSPGENLRPQMFGRGVITLDSHPNALVVPKDAIKNTVVSAGGKTTGTVYVIDRKAGAGSKESGTVTEHQVQVEPSYKTETDVEIVGDVKQGQLVVAEAAKVTLKTGDTVTLTHTKPQTASAQ